MSFEAFAKGFAQSLNQNFKQKRKNEAEWRRTKMQNFITNTVPQYKKDVRKASEIRSRAEDGIRFLQQRKGLSPEKAKNVAWAYADKHENMVDYRKALATEIADAQRQQTEQATQQASSSQQSQPDPISAWTGAADTEANREAVAYDMAETGDQWRQAMERRQGAEQQASQNTQTSPNQMPQSQPGQGDGPGWIAENIFGATNYADATQQAYQDIARMTGYSPGMVKLMEMGRSPLAQQPSGSLAGVQMNTDSGSDLGTLETNVQNAWNELPEEGRQAFNEYMETGDPQKLQQAASMVPVDDGSSGMSPRERMEANVVDAYNALPEEGKAAYNQYRKTGDFEDLKTAASTIPEGLSFKDMLVQRFQDSGGFGSGSRGSDTLNETMEDSGGSDNMSQEQDDEEPDDTIPLSALDQKDIEDTATELQAAIQREKPNDPSKFANKWLKNQGYTADARREIANVFNSNYGG